MLGRLAITLVLLLTAFGLGGGAVAGAGGVVAPDPAIPPEAVVAIQLNALRSNNPDERDSGIRLAWAFAHPENRAKTGPLTSFARMLKGPYYSPLLNHRHHVFAEIGRAPGQVEYRVLMEDRNGRMLAFFWVVKKAVEAPFTDCWMTVAVTPPLPAGRGA